jgi:hypothetical protein
MSLRRSLAAFVSCLAVGLALASAAEARAGTEPLLHVKTDEPALYPAAEVYAEVEPQDRSLVSLVTSERPDEPTAIAALIAHPGRTIVLKRVWGVPAVRASVLPGFTSGEGGPVRISFRWNKLGTQWRSLDLRLERAEERWLLRRDDGAEVRTITLRFRKKATPQELEVE